MEFRYQISEKDYVRASKIACKFKRPTVAKIVLFWGFVILCLVILFGVVQQSTHSSASHDPDFDPPPVTQRASIGQELLINVLPLVVILGFWVFLILYMKPGNTARRQYRRDTNSHGTATVALDAQSFSLRSTVGMSFQATWNVFDGWGEKDGIVVLRYPGGTFQFLIVGGLPESEREQLRGILASALPKK